MEFNRTKPPVRKCEELFDVEMHSMAKDGYPNRREAAVRRRTALLLLSEFSQKDRNVFEPYLALCNFDRFSSRVEFPVENVEVAVVCCLSLTKKTMNSFFSIDRFLAAMPRLNINKEVIPEMEAEILNVLERRMCPVNAVNFVGYFTEMIPDDMRPSPRIVKEIIIQAAGDIGSTQYRPSVIAASGVFIASSVRFPERSHECFERFSSCKSVNKEDLSRCTDMIREICKNKYLFGVTSQAGEASSSSSSTFHRPGKELVAESSSTVEEIETRPGKEQAVEMSVELKREDIPYFKLKWVTDEIEVAVAAMDVDEASEDARADDDSDDEYIDQEGYEADDEGEDDDSDSSNSSNSSNSSTITD